MLLLLIQRGLHKGNISMDLFNSWSKMTTLTWVRERKRERERERLALKSMHVSESDIK